MLSKKLDKVTEEPPKSKSKQKESTNSLENQGKVSRVEPSPVLINSSKTKKKQEKKVLEESTDFENSISLIVAE